MANEYTIKLEKRVDFGKKATKHLRREEKIPGIYYSNASKDSIPFIMEASEFTNALKSEAHLFKVNVGGKSRTVIFKDVQYHPVTDDILHIDLYGVRMDETIDFKVPIQLQGSPIGVTEQGGHLSQMLMELDIICLPSDIPDFIGVDITDLELGSSIHVSNLSIPENIQVVTGEDVSVASVSHGIKEVETVEETEEDLTFEDEEESDTEATE